MNYDKMAADRQAERQAAAEAGAGGMRKTYSIPQQDEQSPDRYANKEHMYPRSPGMRQDGTESSRDGGNATVDDDQGQGGTTGPSGDESSQDAAGVLPSDQWHDEIAAGNYDAVSRSVLSELRGLGCSDAEYSTAQTLCNLASEKRNNREWRDWALEMVDWIRGLRTAK